MKRGLRMMLFIFAALDIGLAGRLLLVPYFFQHGQSGLAAIGLNVVRAVFLVSLVISAYGLIRLRPWAAMAAYAQFPFRLLFCAFSFWFVFDLIGIASGMSWFIAAVVLETARMVATAVTHARVLA